MKENIPRVFFLILLLLACKNRKNPVSLEDHRMAGDLMSTSSLFLDEESVCNSEPWKACKEYTYKSTTVFYKGKIYRNKWYTKGEEPKEEVNNPWRLIAFCNGDVVDCSKAILWKSNLKFEKPYILVKFEKHLYKNRWYSEGEKPSVNSRVWQYIGPCETGLILEEK
ncbi:hypothetical protein ACE1MK_02020 [Tenacibaculum maritimum]|uniref:hypothetical protein n=1 Tax=Tenacibaculum maritimum TaxID=107401 RepID=UPI0012E5ED99|nr:hypothetical protein [Tenacibaculum maritimum]CAA0161253.1 hypothetical protein containing CBM5 domain [Tenacibaculum maritimum]CAA0169826.1 hypothetical protein FS0810_130029 [Tenacibaculum maritimum]CAA0186059.1 hypothetical protein containing CBM5 domain [Tenacibaculum maritimum]